MAIVNLNAIRAKIRRLTGSANDLQLPNVANPNDVNSVGIDDYINSFYLYDFPAQFRSLKLKDIYTFTTTYGVDTYPFNSEQYTTVEMPAYCAKREIALFQDPWSFYGVNYNWQQFTNFASGDGTAGPYSGFTTATPIIRSVNNKLPIKTGGISAATQAANAQITSTGHGLATGNIISIVGVTGMTQLNNNSYTITVNSANTFLLNVDSTAYTAYVSGGVWTLTTYASGVPNVPGVSQGYSGFPAGRVQNILITTNITNGLTLNVTDDGNGNLIGDCTTGTINYGTGAITNLRFSQTVPQGTTIQIQYNPVTPAIPLSILFFQNQFTLRPVPNQGYTVEIVAHRQPAQALMATNGGLGTPELSEWWECIAIGAAKKIFEDRLDSDGIQLMDKMLAERYQIVYTRTYAQMGKQRVNTIFADQITYNYGQGGFGFGGGS